TPSKMRAAIAFEAPRGRWDDRALGEANEVDCDDPQEGLDECCSQCDFTLANQVAKYGLVPGQTAEPTLAMDEVLASEGEESIFARPFVREGDGLGEGPALKSDPKCDPLVD